MKTDQINRPYKPDVKLNERLQLSSTKLLFWNLVLLTSCWSQYIRPG